MLAGVSDGLEANSDQHTTNGPAVQLDTDYFTWITQLTYTYKCLIYQGVNRYMNHHFQFYL